MLRRRLEPELHGSEGYTSSSRLAAIGLAVVFCVLATHLALQAWYDGRMLPGTVIGSQDVGGMSLAAARRVVAAEANGFQLNLNAGGDHYTLGAAQLGVTYNVEATIDSAYDSGRDDWVPPFSQDPVPLAYDLDWSKLNAFAIGVVDKIGVAPVDATVNVKNGQLTTVPDKNGWTVDRIGLEKLVQTNVANDSSGALTLVPRAEPADIRVSMLGPTLAAATKLMATPVKLSYNGQTITPTRAQIGAWLDFVKQPNGLTYKLVPQVDSSKLAGYVQGLAKQLDVAAVNQTMTIVNGASKVTRTGVNGTAIDTAGLENALDAAVTNEAPLAYSITSQPVAFATVSTSLTALNLPQYVEVNLSKQHLWVWQNGQVIYDSPITSGATGAGFPTVTGMFHIYQKKTDTDLVGYAYGPAYDYDDFVQYWMAFYQGFGLHDASWRNGNFGETSGPFGYYYDGSHGCVNLPLATAKFLYGWTTIGTPVWVHN